VLAYAAVTIVLGRDVLGGLSTALASDSGDPLFTATLMYWNATHVPLTEAWWQLPMFHPVRDTLAFSEHLLGLSVITTPLYRLTGDIFLTYNATMLLTYPLCATTMWLLVRRLTGSAAAAFVAGLAFGFAPYRVAHLPHVQMLAVFWAPLVLLGLHAYLETGRRRWLALYGVSWLLQAATNNYLLVLLTFLVGLWVLWFAVARGAWARTAGIASATLVAALPLVPIVYRYLTTHAHHGFFRSLDEMREFGADVAAVLCAPASLTFWGWLRVQCQPEADIFPGAAILAMSALALARVVTFREPGPGTGRSRSAPHVRPNVERAVTVARRLLVGVAIVYAAIVARVLVTGPFRIDLGVLSVSASAIEKPFVIGLGAAVGALLLSPGLRAAARVGSVLGFYVLAALVTWMLALGPTITFLGRRLSVPGPFLWLAALPGVNGLRVPSRFWLITLLCLTVAMGLVVADVLRGRSRIVKALAVAVLAAVVLADGWAPLPVAALPPQVANPERLAGKVVFEMPPDSGARDVAAQYRAVVGGWRTINGYSGYAPKYYSALRDAARFEEDQLFPPLRARGDLEVIVPRDAPGLREAVQRQPGAVLVGEGAWEWQFHLPRQPFHHPSRPGGSRVGIARVQSTCSSDTLAVVIDGETSNRWRCDRSGEPLVADLGGVHLVGAVFYHLGPWYWEYPSYLDIETSRDGIEWTAARSGSTIAEVIQGGFDHPQSLSVVFPFEPRAAAYIRLHHRGRGDGVGWTVSELEVWSGDAEGATR
jgi:hypothetical protein